MWLRPTHFCKAALQVLLPPIFNQSTSSSSQLRQQAPLLQPHCSGPPSSSVQRCSGTPLPAGNALAQVLKPCKRAARHRDRLAAGGWHKFSNTAAQLAFFQAQGAFLPSSGCLWLDYREQGTAMTSPGHSKKRKQSRSVTYAYCIKPNIWRTLLSLTAHR